MTKVASVDMHMEKREPSYTIGENANQYSLENSMKVLLVIKSRPTPQFINSASGYISKRQKISMLTAALFILPKMWKQPNCLLTNDQIKKM